MVTRFIRRVGPRRETLRSDLVAGLPGAISGVPDGMAAAVLAGVNPIHGLYASFAGPLAGGLATSTPLMVITTTSAAALAAGSALEGVAAADRTDALFLMTLVAGAVMIVAGIVRLGRSTRFVSHSVMIGFLTGIAANIIFGQIADLTGAEGEGSIALVRAIDIVLHPRLIDIPTLLAGLSAIAIMALLSRTRAASVGALVALLVPTIVVTVAGIDGIATVSDSGAIPAGLPLPHLPEFRLLSVSVVTGALAIAAIVLVQGAGVAESAPNPDGAPSDSNEDFIAQGVGNLAASLVQGQPVGGSVGRTALNVSTGARTRWAGIFSGIWMMIILAVFSTAVGKVVMATLAGVLIYAAVGSLRVNGMLTVLRTGPSSQIAMITTFVATLILPVAAAVGVGVALSLMLQLNREAMDLSIVRLVRRDDGRFAEVPAPTRLESRAVTALDVYGSLLYAGSRTLQVRLPDPSGSVSPAVVLRLRGRVHLGSTFFVVIGDYADRLAAVGGRLYLSGVDPSLVDAVTRTGRVDLDGHVEIFTATHVFGDSSLAAVAAAEEWLAQLDQS
jgi:SulP family sulfate permease